MSTTNTACTRYIYMTEETLICRVCFEPGGCYPCLCRGTLAIHPICLQRWVNVSGRKKCEICNYPIASLWYDLTRVRSDIPMEMWRLLVWASMLFCMFPFALRWCLFLFQLVFLLHYTEPDGVFLVCQIFTFHKHFILTGVCLRLVATPYRRWCSTYEPF